MAERETETHRSGELRRGPAQARPLSQLPVFLELSGKDVIVAGGGPGALWKAELLASTGANVKVFCDAQDASLQELAERNAQIALTSRRWDAGDLRDCAIAVCDAADAAEAEAFRIAAKSAGVPVNIVDKPAYCDFQFGAIVNRSPLVVGIATGGAAPVFAQALRARIETLLPPGFTRWAQAAREWRASVQKLGLDFRARRTFWEGFSEQAMKQPDGVPDEALRERLAVKAGATSARGGRGRVIMVGAGPGDPELITLKAVRILQSADAVMYDDLVAPAVLDYARREAERIYVGKRGYKPSWGQNDICKLLVEHAQSGKLVVRLKGGDPTIFGRANEEIEALQARGIDFEVVPGITAATGAAASIGASLTEREISRRVQFVTAHSNAGKLPEDLDWKAIADRRATTAVYMGVRTFAQMSPRLIAEGADPDTPVVLIEAATTPDERRLAGTLSDMAARIDSFAPKGACLFLMGFALARAARDIAARQGAGARAAP